jgi:hypothetical protein
VSESPSVPGSWHPDRMANRKRRPPNRNATRVSTAPAVVSDEQPVVLPIDAFEEWVGDATDDELEDATDGELEDDDASVEEVAEAMRGLANDTLEALRRARHRLDAETAFASVFGILEEGAPPELDPAQRGGLAMAAMLNLTRACEQVPAPVTFGFLLLATEQGPAISRAAAAQAAARMLGDGVEPPRWAQGARAALLDAWLVSDTENAVASIGMLFGTGHREHAFSVLVDHEEGGGIVEIAYSEGLAARELRSALTSELGHQPAVAIRDLDKAQLLDRLRAALAAEPDFEGSEAVGAAVSNLYLVDARARQLADELEAEDVVLHHDLLLMQAMASEAP